jgi:GntR family transcriptional regulator
MTKSRPAPHLGSEFFNPFPRYLQIRNILTRRLNDGFAAGDRFPSEYQLCTEFGVSRETVREALRGLESEGLIARHRGKGTFVARLPDTAQDKRLTGLVEDFTELKLNTDANVIRSGVETPPMRIASALHLDAGERLFRILRLRQVDGKPFACHDAFLPLDIGSALAHLDLTHTTLFGELRRTLGIKLVEIYQHIDASTADVSLARLLELEVGAPLLVTRRALSHRRTGAQTMIFESYFRADRYYYTVQLKQRDGKPLRPTPAGNARAKRLRTASSQR